MKPVFLISESLRFGWDKTREHNGLIFQVAVAIIGLEIVRLILQSLFPHAHTIALLSFIISLVEVVFSIGATLIALKIAKGEDVEFDDIIPSWEVGFRYILASLVAGILVMLSFFVPVVVGGGLLLSLLFSTSPVALILAALGALLVGIGVVFGVYVSLRYSMVKFAALDGDHGVRDIIHKSAKMTKHVKWRLIGFLAVVVVLNIIGAILLFVGLLVTVPVSLIATAHVYLRLSKHAARAK